MDGEVVQLLAQPGLSTRIIAESPEMQWCEDRKTSPKVNRAGSGFCFSKNRASVYTSDVLLSLGSDWLRYMLAHHCRPPGDGSALCIMY